MSDIGIWQHANKQNPCPICKGEDWCQFGDRAMKCYRCESAHAGNDGAGDYWYHFYEKSYIPALKLHRISKPIKTLDCMDGGTLCSADADNLGVTGDSLDELGARWSKVYHAVAFPMRDAIGNICGYRLRNASGFKWAVPGSKQGLFIPDSTSKRSALTVLTYLTEGPTDTAALLSMGLQAIGRPNATSCVDVIIATIQRLAIKRVVIVADNDDMKRHIGKYIGIKAAQTLREKLSKFCKSVVYIPPSPCKDVRELYRRGGTRHTIESVVKQLTWTT